MGGESSLTSKRVTFLHATMQQKSVGLKLNQQRSCDLGILGLSPLTRMDFSLFSGRGQHM